MEKKFNLIESLEKLEKEMKTNKKLSDAWGEALHNANPLASVKIRSSKKSNDEGEK